jgi:hypothetical protein
MAFFFELMRQTVKTNCVQQQCDSCNVGFYEQTCNALCAVPTVVCSGYDEKELIHLHIVCTSSAHRLHIVCTSSFAFLTCIAGYAISLLPHVYIAACSVLLGGAALTALATRSIC